MPAVAARAAAATTAATAQASHHALQHSAILAPAVFAAVSAYRHKDVIVGGCKKITGGSKPLSISPCMACKSNWHSLPELSVSMRPKTPCYSREKRPSQLSAASTSFLGDLDSAQRGIPRLPIRRKSLDLPKAYKNDFFRLPFPVLAEKPEWWWRTLACLPYLVALQMSDTGYFIQPFLEHYDFLGDMIFFVPGAVSRLPTYFPMIYCYFAYLGIVKNKEWPHFLRFHFMMGMLLDQALQVVWYTSNFFPLIHYNGTYGMYYWAGVGLAYILVLLQCVRCALAGGYASIPGISDAALIHTLFNIGGFQRPF